MANPCYVIDINGMKMNMHGICVYVSLHTYMYLLYVPSPPQDPDGLREVKESDIHSRWRQVTRAGPLVDGKIVLFLDRLDSTTEPVRILL